MVEKEIIEQCRNGNLNDFRKLVDNSSPFAFSVAFRMIGDEDAARDIVQETMISVWKTIKSIKSPASFKTWLYRIVLNKCYDELRRKKRNPEIIADEAEWRKISENMFHNPAMQLENSEIARAIRLLTDNLSRKQKAVFILADLEEMSNDEISAITGMSSTRVKANLYYARKKICEMIEKYL